MAVLLGVALAASLCFAGASAAPDAAAAVDPDGPGTPILGAALTVLADGTEPWEDRPLQLPDVGTLPGTRGVADAGDDLGPDDGVVRSWDAVVYRASFSVREATAEGVVATVTLSGPVEWSSTQLDALKLAGCPGGATLSGDATTLTCEVGRVEAPPAVTVALDLTARVGGDALQGDAISASMTARAAEAVPDPEEANCPIARINGCDAVAPTISVSAAPAGELRKYLSGVRSQSVGGLPGRLLSWQLEAVLGADGDVRGSSYLVGAPWQLPDWWKLTSYTGRTIDLPVELVGCTSLQSTSSWSCAQPGEPGTFVEVALERLDIDAALPNGVTSSLPQVIGRMRLDLWVPEEALIASRGDVTFLNCFATKVGFPNRTVWQPTDARSQPNLGGIQEPHVNNCSHIVLPVERVPPTPVRTSRPRPGPPGTPRPPATPVPVATVSKRYTPYTKGAAVTDGSEFAAEVAVEISGSAMPGVVACDKWDNSTHILRDGNARGVRVWWQSGGQARTPADSQTRYVVEYATGRWGRMASAQAGIGRAWYIQATSTCDDSAPMPGPGWLKSSQIDFDNRGDARLDAREVNMIRVRFLDAIPAGTTVTLEVLLSAERNPLGSWLMNYGAAGWKTSSRTTWRTMECYGAQGIRTRRECPVPAAGTRSEPGPLGDMLVHVGVPLWLTKVTDPVVPGGSPVVNAGETVGFAIQASTYPRPGDPPTADFPPGAFAPRVTLTDTLPVGLIYETGSASIASEDLNGNGRLDPGEDRNGNGRIDRDVAYEPVVEAGPGIGQTTLTWYLGDLPYEREVRPGDMIPLALYWEPLRDLDVDYSVFIHLVDEAGRVVAQRDSSPGNGNWPTSDWGPQAGPSEVASGAGERWFLDPHRLAVPVQAAAPADCRLLVGVYDHATGDRLLTAQGETTYELGKVALKTRVGPDGIPNPIGAEFGDEIVLAGYEIVDRSVAKGETIEVTLYWHARREIRRDYKVSLQLRRGAEEKWGQRDEEPADGTRPTSSWDRGETVVDRQPVPVYNDAPSGEYRLLVKLYDPEEGQSLPVDYHEWEVDLGRIQVTEGSRR